MKTENKTRYPDNVPGIHPEFGDTERNLERLNMWAARLNNRWHTPRIEEERASFDSVPLLLGGLGVVAFFGGLYLLQMLPR